MIALRNVTMWRPRGSATALGCALSCMLSILVAFLPGTASAQVGLPGESIQSDCRVRAHTAVSKRMLEVQRDSDVGDPIQVSVRLLTTCRAPARPSHLALVVDRGLLTEGAQGDLGRKLIDLTSDLQMGSQTYARLGRIDFDKGVWTPCQMTNDAEMLARCMVDAGRPAPEGVEGTALGMAGALEAATEKLLFARRTRHPPHENGLDPIAESIVLLAKEPRDACPEAQEAVAAARADNIDVDVLCAGGDCQGGCLSSLAPEGTLHTDLQRDWPQVSGWIGERMRSTELRVRRLKIEEWVHPAFEVLPESLDASRVIFEEGANHLRWDVEDLDRRVRYSYALRPRAVGTHTVRRPFFSSKSTYTDTRGRTGWQVKLGNPTIWVLERPPFRVELPWLQRPVGHTGFRPFTAP